ncbi:hypothetical protein GCM10017778_30700 [Streptomyces vinaceus]|nr:hypothetical protein GCM10017778_30700 [Streptomyces vinaceus]
MTEHKVRRLPVIDGHTLAVAVAQAEVVRSLPDPRVGQLSQPPPADTRAPAAREARAARASGRPRPAAETRERPTPAPTPVPSTSPWDPSAVPTTCFAPDLLPAVAKAH